jgi:hypothetical protein
MSIFEKPGIIVLENQPIDPTGLYEYKAILERSTWKGSEHKWVLKIVGLYPDGDSLTPGQWYLDTLLGFDDYGSGRVNDIIYIDSGQKWYVKGMIPVLEEAEKIIYGSEENQLEEFLNEGAVKDLILRGPGREPLLIWAQHHAPFDIEDLIRYAQENELSLKELKVLLEIYMEDATNDETEILSDMEIVILENEREGEISEDFKYDYIFMHYDDEEKIRPLELYESLSNDQGPETD